MNTTCDTKLIQTEFYKKAFFECMKLVSFHLASRLQRRFTGGKYNNNVFLWLWIVQEKSFYFPGLSSYEQNHKIQPGEEKQTELDFLCAVKAAVINI